MCKRDRLTTVRTINTFNIILCSFVLIRHVYSKHLITKYSFKQTEVEQKNIGQNTSFMRILTQQVFIINNL